MRSFFQFDIRGTACHDHAIMSQHGVEAVRRWIASFPDVTRSQAYDFLYHVPCERGANPAAVIMERLAQRPEMRQAIERHLKTPRVFVGRGGIAWFDDMLSDAEWHAVQAERRLTLAQLAHEARISRDVAECIARYI
jgi:hypothetical protein